MENNLKKETEKIISECQECGLCSNGCNFLAESASPAEMARRGITLEEAYGCALCAKCKAVCPFGLSPQPMFQARRVKAIQNQELDQEEFNYFMPDYEENVMNVYRQYYHIDYRDLEIDESSDTYFFPGCTLMTYSPKLTREIYSRLHKKLGCRGILTECCGLPLHQMGLTDRAQRYTDFLIEKITGHGIKRLITACPNCYYLLRETLKSTGVEILTIYEVVDFPDNSQGNLPKCTIHDSCPDRFEGIFARQTRAALKNYGVEIVEMANILQDSPCCGSGGQISHFRPDLADKLVHNRLEEAKHTGAQILVSYCLSCVLNFARIDIDSELTVRHVLNLLLGVDEDYTDVKKQAAKIFAE
ncbi:(Fe-S)-binding protein [Dehalobacter restrictus]|uniref:(Fe-S)-binding protein n=1 Tax=Dehalobacter restrictus TaxID=55583 RepID=A0A857DG78_9FIRM|nr:(Fe-S)-binding protein [Dehalobacter restrictus]QGZ99245.1 (Fe-S)-binding protein [Dehalobacter restrictus]